jgi:GntR family transcriptional regulator
MREHASPCTLCDGQTVIRHNRRVRVDHDLPDPVYLQIADIIRGRIETGKYPPGAPVPSIERIRQETGVSVMTIRKGIGVLAAEGWVRIIPGKGTFVAPQDQWPED